MKRINLLKIISDGLPWKVVEAKYYFRLSVPVERQVVPVLSAVSDTVYDSTRQTT